MSILLPCGSWMRNKILYHEEIEQNQGSELEPLCLKARQEVSWQSQLLGDREKRMCCTQVSSLNVLCKAILSEDRWGPFRFKATTHLLPPLFWDASAGRDFIFAVQCRSLVVFEI